MRLYPTGLIAFIGIILAAHPELQAEPSKAQLIVPGSSIGKTFLGPNGEDYLKRLPTDTASEGGMSQDRIVWLSGKQPHIRILFIHTTTNGALNVKPAGGVTIDEIRITSPEFCTIEGIKCGTSFARILAIFPQAHPANENTANIYLDPARGIAFEFDEKPRTDSRCIAISVFPPNSPFLTTRQEIDELLKSHPSNSP
jgi:hypothetical protein